MARKVPKVTLQRERKGGLAGQLRRGPRRTKRTDQAHPIPAVCALWASLGSAVGIHTAQGELRSQALVPLKFLRPGE